MLKTSATILCTLLAASSVHSQTRDRVFDNFDTSSGVEIVSPTVEPIVSSRSSSRRSSRKRSRIKKTTMSVADGYGLNAAARSSAASLTMGSARSLKGFTTGDSKVDSYIVEASRIYNIDPLLIYSQMHQESGFKKRARSHKGASGLMQLMPATARRFGVTKIYDPEQNIHAGVRYMRWLLDKFGGDVVLALAGYNAGEGAVMKYGWQVPPYRETKDYVARITRRYGAISDPSYVRNVGSSLASKGRKTKKRKKDPFAEYQFDVMAERMPDGRMRLVTQ